MWPEHCVDPMLLAEHDVVVVGGPDTNFWHGGLFEPVAREFARPPSSVPLALDMREPGVLPSYGSRSLTTVLAGSAAVFPHARGVRVGLDERLYPTHAMILACRNPYAAALGRSRWCVFVAGTRSLGTSGAVLALTLMLRQMRRDPDVDLPQRGADRLGPGAGGGVRGAGPGRRGGAGGAAPGRRGAAAACGAGCRTEGLDPHYSDSYVPTEVDYLAYGGSGAAPQWATLGRLGELDGGRGEVPAAGEEGQPVQHGRPGSAGSGSRSPARSTPARRRPSRRAGWPPKAVVDAPIGLEALREDQVGQEDRREGDRDRRRGSAAPPAATAATSGGISQATASATSRAA